MYLGGSGASGAGYGTGDVWADMRATLLASPLAVDALYRSAGDGDGIAVRVIPSRADTIIGAGLRQVSASTVLKVSTDDVTPADGDTFEIAGTVHRVSGQPTKDGRWLFWVCEAPEEP